MSDRIPGPPGARPISLGRALREAADGPLLEAEITPLTNQGRLRITYNWLYSALNCDSNDTSPFLWTLSKLDETHVTLSPKDGFAGMQLYASVRDDWSWYVQVQAPGSADWITAVGRDETLTLDGGPLLVVGLQGFNDQYLAVDPELSVHDGHSGYRVRSVGSENPQARLWFLGVSTVLQEGFAIPTRGELTELTIREALRASGLDPSDEDVRRLLDALS
jgi:hypothetical protein